MSQNRYKEKLSKTVNIRFSENQFKRMTMFCKKNKIQVSDLGRAAILSHMDKVNEPS